MLYDRERRTRRSSSFLPTPGWLPLLVLALVAAGVRVPGAGAAPTGAPSATLLGIAVNDWVFQLQGKNGGPLNLGTLGASKFDLAVIDYSATGAAGQEFTPQSIAALKDSPGGPKVVLAYLSIGEAEKVRFYFQPGWVDRHNRRTAAAPAWLGPSNPSFPDNFKVRYWDPDWQRLVYGVASGPKKSYLDRIIDQGFDGVYLDIIDAFEFWGPGGSHSERSTAAADMVSLVNGLADYARITRGKPGFLVVPQNGSNIIRHVDANTRTAYYAHIDGLGAEDSFFFGNKDENNAYRPQHETLADLDAIHAAGKPVFAIDYVTDRAKVKRFYMQARAHGFIAYAGVRALDRAVANRDYPPD